MWEGESQGNPCTQAGSKSGAVKQLSHHNTFRRVFKIKSVVYYMPVFEIKRDQRSDLSSVVILSLLAAGYFSVQWHFNESRCFMTSQQDSLNDSYKNKSRISLMALLGCHVLMLFSDTFNYTRVVFNWPWNPSQNPCKLTLLYSGFCTNENTVKKLKLQAVMNGPSQSMCVWCVKV